MVAEATKTQTDHAEVAEAPIVHAEAVKAPTVHAEAAEAPTVHAKAAEAPTVEEAFWQALKGAGAYGMIRGDVIKELVGKGFEGFEHSELINLVGTSLDGKLAPGGHGKFRRSRKSKQSFRDRKSVV